MIVWQEGYLKTHLYVCYYRSLYRSEDRFSKYAFEVFSEDQVIYLYSPLKEVIAAVIVAITTLDRRLLAV